MSAVYVCTAGICPFLSMSRKMPSAALKFLAVAQAVIKAVKVREDSCKPQERMPLYRANTFSNLPAYIDTPQMFYAVACSGEKCDETVAGLQADASEADIWHTGASPNVMIDMEQ